MEKTLRENSKIETKNAKVNKRNKMNSDSMKTNGKYLKPVEKIGE